jgi:hypothetical protein
MILNNNFLEREINFYFLINKLALSSIFYFSISIAYFSINQVVKKFSVLLTANIKKVIFNKDIVGNTCLLVVIGL